MLDARCRASRTAVRGGEAGVEGDGGGFFEELLYLCLFWPGSLATLDGLGKAACSHHLWRLG